MWNEHQLLIDRYELQHKLGRTGAGRQTWLASDRHTQQQVILKLLAFSPQMQWDELKLFEREAKVLQSLDHPRIPQYYDYFSIDDQLLWFGLVQEHIPGESLQGLLDRHEVMREDEVRQLAENLLRVLHYLHQFDPPVLHRDIKPSNLILGDDGFVYLVDFGAVQNQAALTGVTFTVVGTCGYAPLEQFWGRAVPASDLYALGATLIHLLTGLAPVDLPQRNSRIEFATAVPQLSPVFRSWLEKLTETALEKRFSTAQEALQALQSKELVQARPSRKLLQPDRSSIQLQRSADTLSVYLPPLKGWDCFKVLKFRDLVSSYFFFAMAAWLARFFMFISFDYLWFLVFVLPIGGAYVYWLALQSCENTELLFEGDRLSVVRRSFRFLKPKRKVILVDNIVGVFTQKINNRHHIILNVQGNECEEYDRHIVQRHLAHPNSLVYRSYHYDIGGWLSEMEALWLMQEIQDWLSGRGY
jgi:hypothetical protein